MKVRDPALKCGISAVDTLYATNYRIYEGRSGNDVPAKQSVMGSDNQGRPLELVTLIFNSGHQLLIHVMRACRHLLDLTD